MKKFILLNLFFISNLLLSACSTGPDFKRENNNDPKSTLFKPDVRSLEAKLNNDKSVSLSWVDDSGFEDGFIVGKQFGDNGSMVILDTLSKNTVNYKDDTKQLDFHTTYFIAAFKNETISEDSLEFKSIRLDFGEFTKISPETSNVNVITVSWESSMPYADKFVIKKGTGVGNEVATIDTIDGTKSSYSYTEMEEIYSLDIYVDALLINTEGEYQEISDIYTQDIYINQPTNLQVSVIDEETIAVTWQDNSVFEEQFIVYQRNPNSQYNPGNTPYIAIDTVSTTGNILINYHEGIFYEFNIAPIKDGNIGSVISPVIVTLNTTAPEFTQIESVSENEIKLYWNDNNVDYPQEFRYPTKRFVLERSVNNGEFALYRTMENSISSISIGDIDPNLKYRFRIRSLSSRYTQVHTAFTKAIVEENQFGIDSWGYKKTLRSTPLGTYFVYEYGHSAGSYGLKLLDPNTGNEVKNLNFNSDFRGFSFSPDEKYVAIFQGNNPGIFDYEESYLIPLYYFSETEREGLFVNNAELFTSNYNSLTKINIVDKTKTKVPAIEKIRTDYPDFQIYEISPYKTDTKIFLTTNKGVFAYDFIAEKVFELNQELNKITDANNDGEILFIKDEDQIVLINDDGGDLQEFIKPEIIDNYYLDFISAKLAFNSYIVVGTNQGILLLFDKVTGEYISYHHISVGSEKSYYDAKPIAVSANGGKLLTFIEGVGKYFTLSEGWTTISYEH